MSFKDVAQFECPDQNLSFVLTELLLQDLGLLVLHTYY